VICKNRKGHPLRHHASANINHLAVFQTPHLSLYILGCIFAACLHLACGISRTTTAQVLICKKPINVPSCVTSVKVRRPFHLLRMLETSQQVGQSACYRLERESLRQTNIQTVSHQVSTKASQNTCDCQTRQDKIGQCRDSMNNIWQRKTEARWPWSSHRMPGVSAGNILQLLRIRAFETGGILPMPNLQQYRVITQGTNYQVVAYL